MQDLSLHILDIAENSVVAKASRIEIRIMEDKEKDLLSLEVTDNGVGMDDKTLKKALDPFYTSKTIRRFGFGLSLLSEAAKAANGNLSIKSRKGKGTQIKANFQYSHIDRRPLGDIGRTIVTLVMANPEIDFIYQHKRNNSEYVLDTREIKTQLQGTPINSFEGIRMIKADLNRVNLP